MDTQKIVTRNGLELIVEQQPGDRQTHLLLRLNATTPCILHWGLRKPRDSQWHLPPRELWPEGTTPHAQAAQSPFAPQNGGDHALLRLSAPDTFSALEFALFLPDQKKWDNNAGRNYQIALPHRAPQLPAVGPALQEQVGQTPLAFKQTFQFRGGGELAVAVSHQEKHYHVWMLSDIPDLVLHWGVAQNSTDEWLSPPHALQPPGTILAQNSANTAFTAKAGLSALELDFSEPDAPLAINFVLKNGSGQWFHNQDGGNFQLPIASRTPVAAPAGSGEFGGIAKQIIGVEIGPQGWTLMHRFNLCHDLLSRVGGNPEGLGLLFVWLRYSALRQLTWQRNYNTKPRELSHAEDRLTLRIAEVYREQPEARPLVRLMLTTVGRGGEGQKVRDEILQIMHRHHIKEMSGHFMEEWHQKLHNNTTPDDIVICEAFLAFLNHNGSRERFYETLRAGGVTRERLQGFERPIRSEPDFHAHIKDALVHDFENFLKILKSVHAGTDLETALNVAQGQLDGPTRDLCYQVWNRRNDPGLNLLDRVALITRARRALAGLLQSHHQVRDLLYLDLALEQYLRGTIEQNIHLQLTGDDLVELIGRVLENLNCSQQDPELAVCALHWGRLKDQPRFGQDWALHAKSVLDRVGRALSRWIDSIYKLLQPQAELLGRGFKADEWTVTLFSEEVVRGNSLGFVCSMLLHHLDPLLRKAARLGDWQIVSRGKGRGLVEVVADLRSVQGKQFDAPRVIIADRVSGDEEVPESVKAVIAPDVTDIVSHVAVRARNANLLFASCFDPALLEKLKSFRGKEVELEVTPAGDVIFNEATGAQATTAQKARAALPRVTRPQFTGWALRLAGL